MKLVCLMPTYGRPSLVASSVAIFQRQRLRDGDVAELWILDDADQIPAVDSVSLPRYRVRSTATRFENLPSKYRWLVDEIEATYADDEVDAFLVWDDDDVYLPNHIAAYAETLSRAPWAHPRYVYSTYGVERGYPRIEPAAGRFHGALGIRADALRRIGGWILTDRATFDQEMIAKCRAELGDAGDPTEIAGPTYCYRWSDSGFYHCSGNMGRPDWYDLTPKQEPPVEILTPRLDDRAAWILDAADGDRLEPIAPAWPTGTTTTTGPS